MNNKLEELLSIADLKERQSALLNYARFLGIEASQAQDFNGEFEEETLVMAIYDSLKSQKKKSALDKYILLGGACFLISILLLILKLPQILKSAYQGDNKVQTGKLFRGFDEGGKPVVDQKAQPVLFELMDGIYDEYDPKGYIKYQYQYKQGELLMKKEFNPKGEVTKEENYK